MIVFLLTLPAELVAEYGAGESQRSTTKRLRTQGLCVIPDGRLSSSRTIMDILEHTSSWVNNSLVNNPIYEGFPCNVDGNE